MCVCRCVCTCGFSECRFSARAHARDCLSVKTMAALFGDHVIIAFNENQYGCHVWRLAPWQESPVCAMLFGWPCEESIDLPEGIVVVDDTFPGLEPSP